VYIFWLGAQKLLKKPTQIISNLENTASENNDDEFREIKKSEGREMGL